MTWNSNIIRGGFERRTDLTSISFLEDCPHAMEVNVRILQIFPPAGVRGCRPRRLGDYMSLIASIISGSHPAARNAGGAGALTGGNRLCDIREDSLTSPCSPSSNKPSFQQKIRRYPRNC